MLCIGHRENPLFLELAISCDFYFLFFNESKRVISIPRVTSTRSDRHNRSIPDIAFIEF
jgi:hypothetical protein